MSFIGSLKKTLAVVMSVTVLSSVGVMAASADATTVNLMPVDVSSIIWGIHRCLKGKSSIQWEVGIIDLNREKLLQKNRQ